MQEVCQGDLIAMEALDEDKEVRCRGWLTIFLPVIRNGGTVGRRGG